MHLRFRGDLARRLACPDYVRAYDGAQHRHAIFQQYPTLLAALENIVGLDGEYGRADGETVDAFFRALLEEHRDHGHPVWSTALIFALFPAIKRQKRQTFSSAHDDDALSDVVLDGCLEAVVRVARVSDRDRLAMRLVQEMGRYAYRVVRTACRDRQLVSELVTVAMDTGAIEPFAEGRRESIPHVGDMLVEIREATRRAHDGDDRELARRLDAAAPLRERVSLLYPDLTAADQAQLYERLKKRGMRAVARVKDAAHHAECEAAQNVTVKQPASWRRKEKEQSDDRT